MNFDSSIPRNGHLLAHPRPRGLNALAEAMGMQVIYYDVATKLPLGNAKQVGDLKELLKRSNIVTLHVPSDATTRGMIDDAEFQAMQPGSILINYSRGDIVDLACRIKRAVQTGWEIPIESGLALERELQQQLFQSDDAREGLAAYNEKRKAVFSGR